MEQNPPVQKYSLKSGWVCLGIALLAILVAGPFGFVVAGPLVLVTFILSIVGLAKNNTGGGITLLLASLLMPGLVFLVWLLALFLMAPKSVDETTGPVNGEVIESLDKEAVEIMREH